MRYRAFLRSWHGHGRGRAAGGELAPRSEERLFRDRVKFRMARIALVSISPDEVSMGFAFPACGYRRVLAESLELWLYS
jgi:hypothetical protein